MRYSSLAGQYQQKAKCQYEEDCPVSPPPYNQYLHIQGKELILVEIEEKKQVPLFVQH